MFVGIFSTIPGRSLRGFFFLQTRLSWLTGLSQYFARLAGSSKSAGNQSLVICFIRLQRRSARSIVPANDYEGLLASLAR